MGCPSNCIPHSRCRAVALLAIVSLRCFCLRGQQAVFVPQPVHFEEPHGARRCRRTLYTHNVKGHVGQAAGDDGHTFCSWLASKYASAIIIVSIMVGGSVAGAEMASSKVSSGWSIFPVSEATGEVSMPPREDDLVSKILPDSITKGAKKTEKVLEKIEMEAAKSVLDVATDTTGQAEKTLNDIKKKTEEVRQGLGVNSVKVEATQSMSAERSPSGDSLAKISKGLGQLKKEATESIKDIAEGKKNIEKAALRTLRSVGDTLDSLQEDIYSESWVTLSTYPDIVRSYLPLFTYYADGVYPLDEDTPQDSVNRQLRSALSYEVEGIRQSVSRLQDAVARENVRDSEEAFAGISLSYDRYLKAGNLYKGYDPIVSTEMFYSDVDDREMVYTRRSIRLPTVRDDVLLISGPDKGKAGKVLWLGQDDEGKTVTAVVKLDANPDLGPMGRSPGAKEVKMYPFAWIACKKSDTLTFFDDFVAGTLAAVFSCALTCPIDTLKVRQQAGLPPIPEEGILGLFAGLPSNLGQYAVPGGIFLAGSHGLTDFAVSLPFVDANNPDLQLFLLVPAGILANTVTLPIRQPFEEMNKLVMTGACKGEGEAMKKMFVDREWKDTFFVLSTGVVIALTRGVPFGALQVSTYEFFKDKLVGPWEAAGLPIALEAFVWGALSGAVTGFLTNPPDVIMTRAIASVDKGRGFGGGGVDAGAIFEKISKTTEGILQKEGISAFASGAESRTVYLAIEACLWFAAYEWLCSNIEAFKML